MTLHHRLDGPADAPVLVLAGSLGTTLELWEPQLAALTARHRVLRYDHPGHGGSEPGPRTIDGFGGAVVELLDELAFERVAFCGLSLGGTVGIWLGANAPGRVERLVLCCTAARFAPASAWQERADAVRAGGVAPLADAAMGRWFSERFRAERPEVVARHRELLASAPAEGYARGCEALRDGDLRPALARIEAPTTVVLGVHDPVVSAEDRRDLLSIRGARLVELDAAHLANVEAPDAFAAAVLA